MLKSLKEEVDQRYHEMWDIDWGEVILAPIVALLVALLAFAWFTLAV